MKIVRSVVLAAIAFWLSACSERDYMADALIDPVVVEILVERDGWIVVQHKHTVWGERRDDISYSLNSIDGNGRLRVFQFFSGGPDDGWHIQDFGVVETSSEELYPNAEQVTWSGLSNSEQRTIERLVGKLEGRVSHQPSPGKQQNKSAHGNP